MIARVAGKPVPTVDDLAVALAQLKPGDRVPVDLHAQTGARSVQVTLGRIPPASPVVTQPLVRAHHGSRTRDQRR